MAVIGHIFWQAKTQIWGQVSPDPVAACLD